jgi:hypothetical protein
MKLKMKLLPFLLIVLNLMFISCDSDDDDNYTEEINAERFTNVEVGNFEGEVPQMNMDIHTEFDYTGVQKVSKIHFDITPLKIEPPKEGEMEWVLIEHLLPEESYAGQINPHIHYHLYYDQENPFSPNARPALGTYKLTITVTEEGGEKSIITREFKVVRKFYDIQVGDNNTVVRGSESINAKFEYRTETRLVEDVRFVLWFKEWREGQEVELGTWAQIESVLPSEMYVDIESPVIDYDMPLNPNFPTGDYWLSMKVTEVGAKEAVRLTVPIKIIE